MSIIIVCVILLFILFYNKTLDGQKFLNDNEKYFEILREDDYNFLLFAKYGDDLDCDKLYKERIRNALLTGFIVLALLISNFSLVYLIIVLIIAFLVFKMPYFQLKSYYKKHLHEIDLLLPYYLKSLEILIQHYTVPVALGKSISDAPEIFRPGLRKIVEEINAGDSTIDPYMEFANTYPVRDSMRMMRLLYRLSLGSQERKQEQLETFSRTISALQAKSRETKYKERLDKMEKKTMTMLTATGAGVMIILLLSIMQIMG